MQARDSLVASDQWIVRHRTTRLWGRLDVLAANLKIWNFGKSCGIQIDFRQGELLKSQRRLLVFGLGNKVGLVVGPFTQ